MTMLYDPTTNQWAGAASDTTVEVSDETYAALMGKLIEPGPDGQPRRPVAQVRADLKAAVKAKRWEVETGGVTLPSGVRVGTKASDFRRGKP